MGRHSEVLPSPRCEIARRVADMRLEISEQVTAVGDAMRGDASYWAVPE
jgi:hypothetical protein